MAVTPREELAEALAALAPAAAAGIELQVNPDDVHVEVVGVGHVDLPLTLAQASTLSGLGRPAKFGRGERTLTDRRVRDTWEVPKELVHVEWSARFAAALDAVRDGLGLPPSCRLLAQLHSVLVYEPGQFFAPHQDSEEDDSMVATLVVTLPSTHTGGELVLHHGERETTYRASKSKVCLVAFYADCLHEVRPVSSGHRVALTYNLLLEGDSAAASPTDEPVLADLTAPLLAHLSTRRTHRYRDEVLDPPNRLVYLLDREYTARGLSWSRLKGADARRVALLRSAADSVDCEVALALAEIQETWDAFEPDDRSTRRRWSEDPARDAGPVDYELESLLDSSIRLTRWTDPAGTWVEDIALDVDADEVCASTPTAQLRPYESEFEGYMGNYGNTMDRWYRRAAVVVWPRARSFAIRAEISPLQALEEVVATVRAARGTGRDQARIAALAAVVTLAPFWDGLVRSQDQTGLLPKALRVASVLDDADTAVVLLRPFQVETLRRSHVKALTKVAGRYGQAWAGELVRTWFGDPRWPYRALTVGEDRTQWARRMPELAQALGAEGETGVAVGRDLLGGTWEYLAAQIDVWLRHGRPSYLRTHLAPLGELLAGLLQAAGILDAVDLRDAILAHLSRHPDAILHCTLRALRTAASPTPDVRERSAVPDLAADCAARLRARLARPARAADDWSVDAPEGCTCDLCAELGAFLRDPHRITLDWPLAEKRRQHVHQRIQDAELPVTHQTRREGRPFVLVLTKSPDLFAHEQNARAQAQADLDWITATWTGGL